MAGRGDTNRPREEEMDEHVRSVADYSGASRGASSSSSTGPKRGVVALDTEKLLKKVEKQYQQLLKKTTLAPYGFLTISRVRELTRNVRPNEYTPHYVPIGPYHWSSSSQLRIDDDEKSKHLAILLDAIWHRRNQEIDKRVLLHELLQEMKNQDVSSCYSVQYGGMGAEKFSHMLLLDGCYLLLCFAGSPYRWSSPSSNNNGEPQQQQEEDGQPTTGGPAARRESATGAAKVAHVDGLTAPAARTESASASDNVDVKMRDTLYLLENQIPFSVVKTIYEFVTRHTPTTPSGHTPTTPSADNPTTPSTALTIFAARVKKELQDQLYISATPEGGPQSDPSHLLHLVRTYFKPPAAQAEDGDAALPVTGQWRRATEYCRYANVWFHPRKLDSVAARSVLDVSLAGGALLVPLLRVDNHTWTILRNLMALEEHHHSVSLPRHVTAYCLFMSQLACTEEDVALLRRTRVVEHFLASDAEAAAGFADLCKGVVLNIDDPNSNYLKPVWHKLEQRYESPWHNLLAWFWQAHCENLGYFAAFVAAFILFAMEVVQGIYEIIEHTQKNK